MKQITAWFTLVGPLAILVADAALFFFDGYESTITAVVRGWAAESPWPEFVFLIGAAILYVHFFRKWP